MLLGHLYRVASASGELTRCLQYLASALEERNMHWLQLAPEYIRLSGVCVLCLESHAAALVLVQVLAKQSTLAPECTTMWPPGA